METILVKSKTDLINNLPSLQNGFFEKQAKFGKVENKKVYVKYEMDFKKVADLSLANIEDPMRIYVQRYLDLIDRIYLFHEKAKRSMIKPQDLETILPLFQEEIDKCNFVGDLTYLQAKLDEIYNSKDYLFEKISKGYQKKMEKARKSRKEIIQKANSILNKDFSKINVKKTQEEMDKVFSLWDEEQRFGFQLEKEESDKLWKELNAVKKLFLIKKNEFFSELNNKRKDSKQSKLELIKNAENIDKDEELTLEDKAKKLQLLQKDWKKLTRLSKKDEDKLYEKFRVINNKFFDNKKTVDQQKFEEIKPILDKKIEIANRLDKIDYKDINTAKKTLKQIQSEYDAAGDIKHKVLGSAETKFANVSTKIKEAERKIIKDSDPQKIERNAILADFLKELK